MAEGILFGMAGRILKNLGSTSLEEIALAHGFKDRLENLKSTINTIKNVLLDAEERQADSQAVRGWLERLSADLFAADDLFDEVVSRKQFTNENNWAREVRNFFRSSIQVTFAFSISDKIKTITEKLDDLIKDSADFAFISRCLVGGNVVNIRRGRDQTNLHVDAEEVIGREDDKKAILDVLLAKNKTKKEHPDVISIVGTKGQGKTTLARLIYNDPRVDKYFNLKLWVHVSDLFDIKVISEKILKSATNAETQNLEMNQIKGLLHNQLRGMRYLLVLDDVCNENREKWVELRAILTIGRTGSKFLVTTRSREVANIMDSAPLYELQGLSEEKSWKLFQKIAFTPEQLQQKPGHMITVGKEIVKKCANVPFAIRVVGSLLYGQDDRKWMSIKTKSLANFSDILKLSYQHLPSPLKNCFAYCALYPKDYEFNKETLIELWMAEGFIIPLNDEDRDMEDLAENYFLHLLQRCFFQDIKLNKWGDITSCKMHDLVHDLAQQMARVKCKVAKSEDSGSNKEIQNLSLAYHLTSRWVRTYLLPDQEANGSRFSKSRCQELISSFSCLRVLDLHGVKIKVLSNSIGKLIHLRYLNLSQTCLRILPDSITKLQNLQSLNISKCLSFRALPKNMRELTNLRSLNVDLRRPYYMPSGIGELTLLTKLPHFVVNTNSKLKSAKLSDLNILNLRGKLQIEIRGKLDDIENPLLEAQQANLDKKERLSKLYIDLYSPQYDINESYTDTSSEIDVLEGLKPHSNLKKLTINWYRGWKLPSWAMNDLCATLPNLVEVCLLRCDWCQCLPPFRRLRFLRRLSVAHLASVEYMETGSGLDGLSLLSGSSSMEPPFFPSLEELTLTNMENLRGWWQIGATRNDDTKGKKSQQSTEERLSMSFSKLRKLIIKECRKLTFLPHCPNVEELTVVNVHRSIKVSEMTATTTSTASTSRNSKLKLLTVSNVEDLISFPGENNLRQLLELHVQDGDLWDTGEIRNEVFTSLSSSLRTLQFTGCDSLISFNDGVEQLTAIERLVIMDCIQLELSANDQLPWKNFKSLGSLQLHGIPKLFSLPSGIQHLTNLRSLEIQRNLGLRMLPEWISCLSSLGYLQLYLCPKLAMLPLGIRKITTLKQLEIIKCPKLKEGYRAPKGHYFPLLDRIPLVSFQD